MGENLNAKSWEFLEIAVWDDGAEEMFLKLLCRVFIFFVSVESCAETRYVTKEKVWFATEYNKTESNMDDIKKMRRPGIEPGSTAWKATMLTITPATRLMSGQRNMTLPAPTTTTTTIVQKTNEWLYA